MQTDPGAPGPAHRDVEQEPVVLGCESCGRAVSIDTAKRRTLAADGRSAAVIYSDQALLVWDCPLCQHTNAEDLTD